MRLVVETPCEHAAMSGHHMPIACRFDVCGTMTDSSHWCPGGSQRVLTPGEYVLIEKVDGEWPEEVREPIMEMLHPEDGPIPDDAYKLADTELWARIVGWKIVALEITDA